MALDPLLIADPDTQSRQAILKICATLNLKAIDASSLRDAQDILKSNSISKYLVSGSLSDLFEFGKFLQICNTEKIFIYGRSKRKIPGLIYLGENISHTIDDFLKKHHLNLLPNLRQMYQGSSIKGESDLILIGASTGGVTALETILKDFKEDCPPIMIVQHMRDGYVEGMVARFKQIMKPEVLAAEHMRPIVRGRVYIASNSNNHLGLISKNGILQIRMLQLPPVSGHCPSVDVLFSQAALLAHRIKISAALLTGMGIDGAQGLLLLRQAGANTIAQDKLTSVVWGMPRVAIERGAACQILDVNNIASALKNFNFINNYKLGHGV